MDQASAQSQTQSLTIRTGSDIYDLGEIARITGKVGTVIADQNVVIKWIKPDRKTISDSITPKSDGTFSATLKLDPDKISGGKWSAEASYSGKKAGASFIVRDSFFDVEIDDDDTFESGERVRIAGEIDRRDPNDDTITIAIVNSNGSFFETAEVWPNGRRFEYSFDLEGPRVSYGEWTVDLRYIEGHRTAVTFTVVPSPVVISLNKSVYLPGDTVTITGNVTQAAISVGGTVSKVAIVVTNPDGETFDSASIRPTTNGSYVFELGLLGSFAASYGDWKVTVTYDDHKAKATFAVKEPQSGITVKTDKSTFLAGQPIKVTGRAGATGGFVGIHFFTEQGSLYRYAEVKVQENFTYFYELIPDEDLAPGVYELLVTLNNKETRLSFTVKSSAGTEAPRGNSSDLAYSIDIDGRNYDVRYALPDGNDIENITLDRSARTLVVEIKSNGAGILKIELPRELIDALDENGRDRGYLVSSIYANGSTGIGVFLETNSTDKQRTLIVNFGEGTDAIVITGTQVIPEFSAGLSAAMLAAAAAFVFAARYRGILGNRARWSSFEG